MDSDSCQAFVSFSTMTLIANKIVAITVYTRPLSISRMAGRAATIFLLSPDRQLSITIHMLNSKIITSLPNTIWHHKGHNP